MLGRVKAAYSRLPSAKDLYSGSKGLLSRGKNAFLGELSRRGIQATVPIMDALFPLILVLLLDVIVFIRYIFFIAYSSSAIATGYGVLVSIYVFFHLLWIFLRIAIPVIGGQNIISTVAVVTRSLKNFIGWDGIYNGVSGALGSVKGYIFRNSPATVRTGSPSAVVEHEVEESLLPRPRTKAKEKGQDKDSSLKELIRQVKTSLIQSLRDLLPFYGILLLVPHATQLLKLSLVTINTIYRPLCLSASYGISYALSSPVNTTDLATVPSYCDLVVISNALHYSAGSISSQLIEFFILRKAKILSFACGSSLVLFVYSLIIFQIRKHHEATRPLFKFNTARLPPLEAATLGSRSGSSSGQISIPSNPVLRGIRHFINSIHGATLYYFYPQSSLSMTIQVPVPGGMTTVTPVAGGIFSLPQASVSSSPLQTLFRAIPQLTRFPMLIFDTTKATIGGIFRAISHMIWGQGAITDNSGTGGQLQRRSRSGRRTFRCEDDRPLAESEEVDDELQASGGIMRSYNPQDSHGVDLSELVRSGNVGASILLRQTATEEEWIIIEPVPQEQVPNAPSGNIFYRFYVFVRNKITGASSFSGPIQDPLRRTGQESHNSL